MTKNFRIEVTFSCLYAILSAQFWAVKSPLNFMLDLPSDLSSRIYIPTYFLNTMEK